MDFSQFSGINSIFSLIGMLVIYGITEILKWQKKKKTANATKENIYLALKRLELLNMMQHSPHEKAIITQLFSEYKQLGGNSYVDGIYADWLKNN
jgi:hypothetical protein